MDRWEYHMFEPHGLTADDICTALNNLGKEGWECFDIYRGSSRFDHGFVELHCKRRLGADE